MIMGSPPPSNRLDFIKQIPKQIVILEIAALNSRLKPSIGWNFRYSIEDQMQELFYFCGGNKDTFNIWNKRIQKAFFKNRSKMTPSRMSIFSRPANLLLIQEVIQHRNKLPHDNHRMSPEDWENLFKYYLCINEIPGSYDKGNSSNFNDLEILAANQIFLNELSIILNPILSLDRFTTWIEVIKSDATIGRFFNSFFNPVGFSFEYFLKQVISIFARDSEANGLDCHYNLDTTDQYLVRFFDELSFRTLHSPKHKWDLSEIRKGPFYKEEQTNKYILLDNIFLIEKIYEQFINDFYDKYLKESEVNFDFYRGQFGGFFERYIASFFSTIYSSRKHAIFKSLDELKVKIKKQEHELADLYLRENKKIFIAQIKSNGLRSDQFSGNPSHFFCDSKGKNPDFLYENFGLFQLIKSIEYLKAQIAEVDHKFPLNKKIEIFPALIVNEKLFHTPLMPRIFNEKFQEKLPSSLPSKFIINPLVIIHVQDVEDMANHLKTKKIDLWKLLRKHYKGAYLEKPFNITLKRNKILKDIRDIKSHNFIKYIQFDKTSEEQE